LGGADRGEKRDGNLACGEGPDALSKKTKWGEERRKSPANKDIEKRKIARNMRERKISKKREGGGKGA